MQSADIEWRGSVPVSRRFGDVYYNPQDGLAESRHVFLRGNDLPDRWAGRETFQIGEIGFGTGLNFLATLRAFRETNTCARLGYFSCERFPLKPEDLERALTAFPEVAAEARALRPRYPSAVAGMHRILLEGGRVSLTLLWGDALESLQALDGSAFDAWYLDGFAPDRNPELWQERLFGEVARLSRPGATAATFSVAGAVRRALQSHGFTLTKVPGFGRKREMLRAELPAREGGVERPASGNGETREAVVIIGAGLAGTAAAEALTRRGRPVILVEREAGPATGASGNSAGLAFPWLTAEPTPISRLSLIAFAYVRSLFDLLDRTPEDIQRRETGVLQLLYDANIARRLERGRSVHGLPEDFARIIDANEAGEVCGFPLEHDALYYPAGTLVSPRAICAAQLHLARERGLLRMITHREALSLHRSGAAWEVRDGSGDEIARGSAIVLAAADDCMRFQQSAHIPLRRVRGQVLRVPEHAVRPGLRAAVCFDGYVTPAVSVAMDTEGDREHWVGATFEEWNQKPEVLPEQNIRLWERARALLPDWPHSETHETVVRWSARAAFRSASQDRFPVIGPAPDTAHADQVRRPEDWLAPENRYPGLYLHTAHGSRGLLTATMGAEYLAARMSGETLPLPRDLVHALHPGRFLARRKKRGLPVDT